MQKPELESALAGFSMLGLVLVLGVFGYADLPNESQEMFQEAIPWILIAASLLWLRNTKWD